MLTFQSASVTISYADVKNIKWPSELSKTAKAVLIGTVVAGMLFLGVFLLGGLKN